MKICPQCRSNYTDDTLQFCLQDGTALESGESGSQYDTSDMATVSFEETATVVSKRPPEKITFNIDNPPEDPKQTRDSRSGFSSQSEPAGSNTLLVVLVTASAMIVLFGVIGAGVWYFLNDTNQVRKNSNNTLAGTEKPVNSAKTEENTTPSRTTSPDSSKSPTPEKTPSYDREKLIEGVGRQISSWKQLAEARDLSGYMAKYGTKIDYYTRSGATREFVMRDKQKAFTNYTSIKTKLSNISITPGTDGKKATAVFDKEWDFSGPAKSTTGKVRSQLVFEKTGDDWLIVSERDLKVYYVK